MKAYKLLRLKKDGHIYPLFINKKQRTPMGKWLIAECFPTTGFAVRTGWHCCIKPFAPHLKRELKSGERRVWVECEVKDYTTYNRPESQGGTWILAQCIKLIRILNDDEIALLCADK